MLGHREQWAKLEGDKSLEVWVPESDWHLLTWSMGTWSGLALSHHWHHNPPKSWLALSPFLELCPERGGKVRKADLETLLASFNSNPDGTLELFEKRQGGKTLWADGLGESDHELLARSLEALLKPCPWKLDSSSKELPVKVEIGRRDRLVSVNQSQTFADLFMDSELEILEEKKHAIFYEASDVC